VRNGKASGGHWIQVCWQLAGISGHGRQCDGMCRERPGPDGASQGVWEGDVRPHAQLASVWLLKVSVCLAVCAATAQALGSDEEDGEEADEDGESEDEELLEAAADVLPALAGAMGADAYAPVFAQLHVPALLRRMRGSEPAPIRAAALGARRSPLLQTLNFLDPKFYACQPNTRCMVFNPNPGSLPLYPDPKCNGCVWRSSGGE
jgi:hypothetical protein